MKKSKRILAFLTAVAFIFIILSSSLFIIEKSGHPCCGNGCTVCSMLKTASDSINTVRDTSHPTFSAAVMSYGIVTVIVLLSRLFKVNTLCDLQVKLTS